MITIVCPTVRGREPSYEFCMAAYEATTVDDFQFITIFGEDACGKAWEKGARQMVGDYLHFTADDLEPLDGWDIEARLSADDGLLPAPIIYTRDSGQVEELGVTPDGFFSRIPFCTREQWQKIGPMIPIHYYTDNWFSWKAKQFGYMTVGVASYRFNHHWAMEGRYGNDRMSADYAAYERYKREGYG